MAWGLVEAVVGDVWPDGNPGELRAAAGAQLRARVLAHHDVNVAAPALLADLDALVAAAR